MSLQSNKLAMRESFTQEIMALASKEMAVNGVENLSLRQIALTLGCSIGTIYLYFKQKQSLVDAVIEQSFDDLHEALKSIRATSDPIERLRRSFAAYVQFGLENPNHYRCAFGLSGMDRVTPYRPHKAFDLLREITGVCIDQALFRPIDRNAASQVIWVSAHGLTSLLIVRPDFPWVARRTLIREVFENTVRGLLIAQRSEKRRDMNE